MADEDNIAQSEEGDFTIPVEEGDFTIPKEDSLFAEPAADATAEPKPEPSSQEKEPPAEETQQDPPTPTEEAPQEQPLSEAEQEATEEDALRPEEVVSNTEALQQDDNTEASQQDETLELSQELVAQLSELRAMISAMRSADPDGNASDDIADLEAAHTSMMSILSSLTSSSGVVNVGALKAVMERSKQRADGAISAATTAGDVSETDIRSEKYSEALTYWRETQSSYALEMYYAQQLSGQYSQEAVQLSVKMATKYAPDLFEHDEAFVKDVVGMEAAVMDSPEGQEIARVINNVTPEQEQVLADTKEQALNDYRWAMRELPEGHPLREKLQYLYAETDGKFTVAIADELAALREKGVQPDSLQQFDDLLHTAEDRFEKSYDMLWSKLSDETRQKMMAELEAKGVDFDPDNPDWSKVHDQISALPSEDASELSKLRYGQQITHGSLTMYDSILQLEARQLEAFEALGFEEKMARAGISQEAIEQLPYEQRKLMEQYVDELTVYARENPEAYQQLQESPEALERFLTEAAGVKYIEGQLSVQQEQAYEALFELRTAAAREAYKQASEDPSLAALSDPDLKARAINAKADLLLEEIEAEMLATSESKELISKVHLTDNLAYDKEKRVYVDKETGQTVTLDEVKRQANGQAVLNPETGNLETLNQSVPPSMPDLDAAPSSAQEGNNLLDDLQAKSAATVTVQGGLIASAPSSSVQAQQPANQNMLAAVQEVQAGLQSSITYDAPVGAASSSQASAIPDQLPSLGISGGESVEPEEVTQKSVSVSMPPAVSASRTGPS